MKKKFLLLLILIFSVDIYAQENTNTKPAFQLEFGVTAYSFNIAFGGFDLDFIIPFYTKGINTLSVKTSIITFVPSSIFQPVAPFILFGGIVELQYSLSTKRGFLFSLETGLGVASEFFQTPVFTLEKGFQDNFISQPYGIFSSGLRMGYDFNKKFMQPFKFTVFLGYRMQFPFNFTIKHFIMYGASLSYKFDFVGGKK